MVAGETSGDLLASRLLSGLRPMLPDARIHGIGGKATGSVSKKTDYVVAGENAGRHTATYSAPAGSGVL